MTAGSATTRAERLRGFGRTTESAAEVVEVRSAEGMRCAVADAGTERGVAMRGRGRSYGDAAQNAGGRVVLTPASGRIVDFDPATGEITTTAGLTLGEILRTVVPHGWFLPVTPGTRHVTVGGAVASDVHGKDHPLAGSWCSHVSELTLATPDGSTRVIGPAADPDLFWATAGGMGLTGAVVDCTFRLQPIETAQMVVDTDRVPDLDAVLDLLSEPSVAQPFAVAWLDLAQGRRARGIVSRARFARLDELPDRRDPFRVEPTRARTVPRGTPAVMAVRSLPRLLNSGWFRLARPGHCRLEPFGELFYALDRVEEWNRLFGRAGFIQWQVAVPDDATSILRTIVDRLQRHRVIPTMAVLKRLGAGSGGMLSFPAPGWTLALDLPADVEGLGLVLDGLDDVVATVGGRIYLAKDGRMRPELLRVMYPRLDEWRAVRERVDPAQRMRTDLGRRLGLCP